MAFKILNVLLLTLLITTACAAQDLSVKWEELTAPDFIQAIEQADGVCLLPFGIIEKHGPAGPLGTDLINVRHTSVLAAQQEYALVFPEYYFGQIFEAMHQPGTIAYSRRLQLDLLQETVAEMARNGCRKVVIINGHGGNTSLIQYFTQTQIDTPKDYVVYALLGLGTAPGQTPSPAAAPSAPGADGHGGESELASVMASRPDLAHPERSDQQSGADQERLDLPQGVYTAIFWYASYPNHYSGDSSGATAERGRALVQDRAEAIANAIRAIKADESAPRLQQEYFDQISRPLETQQ